MGLTGGVLLALRVVVCRYEDIGAVPAPGPNDVKVKMLAAPINPADFNMVRLLRCARGARLQCGKWQRLTCACVA